MVVSCERTGRPRWSDVAWTCRRTSRFRAATGRYVRAQGTGPASSGRPNPVHDAVQVLQCGGRCLHDLIKWGYLSGGKMRNWQTGRWCHSVPASVLVDFKTKFMSLHELKLALKTDRAHALVWAAKLAIPAEIDVGPYSKFYSRETVARHL